MRLPVAFRAGVSPARCACSSYSVHGMDCLLGRDYDVRGFRMIGDRPGRRNGPPEIDGGEKEADMSDETAREIAEREIGRTDDKRKTPERRAYRSGNGRRRSSGQKPHKEMSQGTPRPVPPPSSAGSSTDQRRFSRV
jgi:hypothetical protein